MIGKWLQLLKEVAPGVTRVAVIFNPDTAAFRPLFDREIEAARSFGVTVTLAPVHDDAGIEEAIAAQASRAQPRGKPGFSTPESSSGRETDSPLEGAGFEPSVPGCDRPSANS